MCDRDYRCTDGLTWCESCNGHGRVNPKGKAYRVRCRELPAWSLEHVVCAGSGLVACSACADGLELDALSLAVLQQAAVAERTCVDAVAAAPFVNRDSDSASARRMDQLERAYR